MHYLASFYKNKAEQLQERVNFLKSLLIEGGTDEAADWSDKQIDDFIDYSRGGADKVSPEDREQLRELLRRRRDRARAARGQRAQEPGSSTGSSQSSSREEEMRRENARRQAEAAQAQQDRERRQAEADERQRQRANQASEDANRQRQAEEAARRQAEEAARRSAYEQGRSDESRSWQDAEERIRREQADFEARVAAEEEAGKFSNRAKKAASGAWEAAKAATDAEMATPTFSAMGRYAQQMFQKPGETARAAASGIGSAAAYSVKHPLKTTGNVVGTVANIGVPLVAGIGAEAVSDKAMEMMGFERNQPENERNDLTKIFSEKPSARSLVNYSTMFGATDATAQAMANARAMMNTSIPSFQKPGLMSGTGRQALRGGIAGALAHLTGHVFYKAGEALGQKLGLHDNLGEKEAVAAGQHAPGMQRLGNYPTVAQLQAQSRKQAEEELERLKQKNLDRIGTKDGVRYDLQGMIGVNKKERELENRREAAKRREEAEYEANTSPSFNYDYGR